MEVGCAGRDVQRQSKALAAKKGRERDSLGAAEQGNMSVALALGVSKCVRARAEYWGPARAAGKEKAVAA